MTDETNGEGQPSAEDTAAVLAHAALEGDKTFLTPKDEAQAQPGAEENPGEDAPAATPDEGEAGQPKPKQTAQERIAELTRLRRDAERDRDFYKEQALRGGSQEKPPAEQAQPQPQADGRPKPEDFDGGVYDPAYIDSLTDWKAEQAVTRHLANRDQRQAISTSVSAFETKVAEIYPDGEPEGLKAFRALPTLPQGVADVLLVSDIAPKLAEHLGVNPAEMTRLSGLSPALQARELGLIESRLAPPAKPPAKTLTDAPEPAPQARGSGGQFKVAADTDDFASFEKQYRIGG